MKRMLSTLLAALLLTLGVNAASAAQPLLSDLEVQWYTVDVAAMKEGLKDWQLNRVDNLTALTMGVLEDGCVVLASSVSRGYTPEITVKNGYPYGCELFMHSALTPSYKMNVQGMVTLNVNGVEMSFDAGALLDAPPANCAHSFARVDEYCMANVNRDRGFDYMRCTGCGQVALAVLDVNGEAVIPVWMNRLPAREEQDEQQAEPVSLIVPSPRMLVLKVGETQALSCSVYPEGAAADLTYSGEGRGCFSVSADGAVTALTPGQEVLTVIDAASKTRAYVFVTVVPAAQ